MQLFIALGVLAVASTAYLLYQFWTRSLATEPGQQEAELTDAEAASSTLKAA